MDIKHSLEKETLAIELSGDLDLASYPEMEQYLKEIKNKYRHMEINLERVFFMDSAALYYLMHLKNAVNKKGGTFSLVNVFGQIKRLLEVSGVYQYFIKNE